MPLDKSNFWGSTSVEPKRSFRWVLTIGSATPGSADSGAIQEWMARTVKKPSFTISNIEHPYIAYKFNFPGRVTWDPVEVTLVDPMSPNAEEILTTLLTSAGLRAPVDAEVGKVSITREGSTAAWGNVKMTQINAAGENVDSWVLYNAWVERADFGQLDYTSEELINLTLTFRYDYARYSAGDNGTESF